MVLWSAAVSVLDFLDEELAALERAHRRRIPRVLTGAQGARIVLDGRAVVSFSSNDYLGLAAHPALREAMAAAAAELGVGAGASRLIVGNSELHERLEAALAELHQRPAARLFSSGFAANSGLVPVLAGAGDEVFSDALNHASIIDGCRLSRGTVHVFEHGNYKDLEGMLASSRARRKIVVTESLFSMDGDLANLSELRTLATEHGAVLVVDDAHATGLFHGGAGLASAAGADVIVGTLGKSLGGFGAWVAGPRALADVLWNRARSLVFSTGIPPAVAAAGLAGVALVRGESGEQARARLWSRVAQMKAGLESIGLGATGASPIIPLEVGDDREVMRWTSWLLERGFYVQGIRPPTVPEGTARLRIAVSAGHDEADVAGLVEAIAAGIAAGLSLRDRSTWNAR